MPDPSLEQNRTTPDLKIKIEGQYLPLEVEIDVQNVTVSDYHNGASTFCLDISIWDADQQEFKYIDEDVFAVGKKCEIMLGYDEEEITSIIKGEITTWEPEFNESETATLKVQGYDSLHRFRRGRNIRTFTEMKDSDIAQQIAGELSLQAQVDNSEVTHAYLLQNNLTDIDFLAERAGRIRYELFIEDGTLHFRKTANNEDNVVTLEYGLSLRSFYPRLNSLSQVSEIIVQGWDPINKQPITGNARSGDEVSKMGGSQLGAGLTESAFFESQTVIVDNPIFNEGEANQIAKGKFNEMVVAFISGEGTTIGNPDIRAGQVIKLLGLGERFSGLYYLTSVTHILDSEGYVTKFTVERNAI